MVKGKDVFLPSFLDTTTGSLTSLHSVHCLACLKLCCGLRSHLLVFLPTISELALRISLLVPRFYQPQELLDKHVQPCS